MRVSNEQAKQLKQCDNMTCSGCRAYDEGCAIIGRSILADNLLEARSIIRDFRRAIKENNLAIDCHCDGCNMIMAAMERSKEYDI